MPQDPKYNTVVMALPQLFVFTFVIILSKTYIVTSDGQRLTFAEHYSKVHFKCLIIFFDIWSHKKEFVCVLFYSLSSLCPAIWCQSKRSYHSSPFSAWNGLRTFIFLPQLLGPVYMVLLVVHLPGMCSSVPVDTWNKGPVMCLGYLSSFSVYFLFHVSCGCDYLWTDLHCVYNC